MSDIEDFLEQKYARQRRSAANNVAMQGRDPAKVARARKIAQAYGIATPLVEDEPEQFEEVFERDRTEEVLKENQWMVPHLLENADTAAIANSRSLAGLSHLSKAIEGPSPLRSSPLDLKSRPTGIDIPTRVPEAAPPKRYRKWTARDYVTRVPHASAGALGETVSRLAMGALGAGEVAADVIGLDEALDPWFREQQRIGEATLKNMRPEWMGDTRVAGVLEANDIQSGVVSTAMMVAPLPFGKAAILPTLVGATAGEAYQRFQGYGAGVGTSLLGAGAEGTIEYITERGPIGYLTKHMGDAGVSGFVKNYFLKDIIGEQFAAHGQEAVDIAINPDRTAKDWTKEFWDRSRSTFVSTVTTSGMVGGGIAVMRRFNRQVDSTRESIDAMHGQTILDETMERAADNEMRTADPEAFARFVSEGAKGSPIQNVYLPIEAVDAVLANEEIPEEEKAAFTLYQDQLEEARVNAGAEIVIPIGEAAAHFAGTKMWQSLREDARVLAGGISGREARANLEKLTEELETIGNEAIEENKTLQPQIEAKVAVYNEVKAQMLAAKRSEKEAQTTAALFASRAENLASARYGKFKDAREAWKWMQLQIVGEGQKPKAKGGKKLAQAQTLAGEEIARYIAETEGGTLGDPEAQQEAFEDLRQDFTGTVATLRSVPLKGLKFEADDPDILEAYRPLETEAPAVVVRNGEVIDGHHRATIAKERGASEILAYVVEDAPAVVNIGLDVNDGSKLTVDEVVAALKAEGVEITEQEIAQSTTEPTLVAKLNRALTPVQATRVSERLRQDAIAQRVGEEGALYGPAAEKWGPFNPEYFLGLSSEQAAQRFSQSDLSELEQVASAEGALEVAKLRKFPTIRDFKLELQGRVRATGTKLRDRKRLIRLAIADARLALANNKNAIGWYDEKMQQAMAVLGELHPEINTDEDARFAFIYAVSVTSQGLKVARNFKLADLVYREFRKTGKMPLMGEGTSGQVMKNALQLFNQLTERMSISELREFMLTEHTVSEIEKALGVTITGEGKGTRVRGAAILGPKIGNGYFSNLYGDFSQLTMDRWFIRTWGRWTGTLVNVDKAAVRRHTVALKNVVRDLTPAQRRQLEIMLSGKRTPYKIRFAEIDVLAKKIAAASSSADVRRQLQEMHPRLRLDAQALAVAMDGQKEAPQSAGERNEIRSIFNVVLSELQNDNPELTMADLQAVLWYPEKRLYDTAKEDSGRAVQLDMFGAERTEQESLLGYENDDAPDYANAAVALARAEGVAQEKIDAALQRASARVDAAQRAKRAGRADRGGAAVSRIAEDENGFPLEDVLSSVGDGTQDPMVLQQFGGLVAAQRDTAVQSNLRLFHEMERGGAYTPEEMWRLTGWESGPSGLRFEIDDSEAYITEWPSDEILDEYEVTPGVDYRFGAPRMYASDTNGALFIIGKNLGDIFHHPTLFKLYPELRTLPVYQRDLGPKQLGYFDFTRIVLNSQSPEQEKLSTILHEVQHAVQFLEGFANGAGHTKEALIDQGYGPELARYIEWYAAMNEGLVPDALNNKGKWKTQEELEAAAAYATYFAVWGEVEARNTQRRALLDAAERRERYPAAASSAIFSEDMPREAAIVHMPDMERQKAASSVSSVSQGPRGEATFFPDGRTIIQLFAKADFSTMLHEMSHVFLQQEFTLAKEKGASQELKDDIAKLTKWFADHGHPVDKNGMPPVGAHELFARTGERYFREGKAPSAELRGAFKQFKEWLTGVYKTVQDLLAYGPAPINPEIREIMDRMIATSEAIDVNATAPMSREELGMTAAEYAAYLDSVNTARDVAHDKLLERMMKAIRRREQGRMREQRANVRAEIADEVNSDPRFVALHLLRTGRWLGEPDRERTEVKINTGWLIDNYGEEILNQLPVGLQPLHRGDGVVGDVIAEMVGLPSGDALVQSLLDLKRQADALKADGNPRPLRDQIIEDLTDAAMAERHGDIAMSEQEIEEEAIAALNSQRQGEVLATELRQLKKQRSAGLVTPYQLLREWARRKVNEGTVADAVSKTALQRYIRGYNKARNLFEEAILGKKPDEAIKQKQAQMINHALLAEGKVVADEINTIVRRLQRYARTKALASIDQDYMDRIHELLEGYNFRNVSDAARAEKASFEAWAKGQQDAGHEVFVPERFRDERTNWKDAKVAKLLELNDMVESLAHIGKTKQRLRRTEEERRLNEIRDDAESRILSLPERKLPESSTGQENQPFRLPIYKSTNWAEWKASVINLLRPGKRTRQAAADLIKVEGMFDILDGTANGTGPLNRYIIQPATDAANTFSRLLEEVMDPIIRRYHGMSKAQAARMRDFVTIPELTLNVSIHEADQQNLGKPLSIPRSKLLGLIANMGNLSNAAKLVGGERWGDPESAADIARVRDILISHASKEDLDLVQDMWDGVAKLWPHIVQVERELSGVVPEEVVSTPFEAFGVEYRGGYWPVVWDSTRSDMGKKQGEEAETSLQGVGFGIATPKGHTITRTGAMAPMEWSIEHVLFGHLNKVLSRIAYAPWVRDTLKIVDNQRIGGAIRLRLGDEYVKAIKPWMRDQIPSNHADLSSSKMWEKFLNQTRINMTITVLGISYTTGMAQLLGLGYSAGVLGEGSVKDGGKWVATGIAKMIQLQSKGFGGAQEFVFSRSEEMKRRAHEVNVEATEVFQRLKDKDSIYRRLQAAAFWHIGFIDLNLVSIPTWMGGYHKGLSLGLNDAEASSYADKTVRLSQGSGRRKDMAAIQRGNAGERFISMFYTPSSVFFNQQWQAVQHLKAGNWSKALAPTFWFLAMTTIMDAFREGDWPEDDDEDGLGGIDIAEWVSRNILFGLFYGIPVARDVTNTTERHIRGEYAEYGTTPLSFGAQTIGKGIKAGKKALEGEDLEGREIKSMANAVGFLFGLPGNQFGKTGGFIEDVSEGRVDPETPYDWYRGLAYGKPPPEQEQ